MLHMQNTGPIIANLPSESPKSHAKYFELQTYVGTFDWIGWRWALGGEQEHVNLGPQGDIGLVSDTKVNYPDKETPQQISTQHATTTPKHPHWTQQMMKSMVHLQRWNTDKAYTQITDGHWKSSKPHTSGKSLLTQRWLNVFPKLTTGMDESNLHDDKQHIMERL
jgi:hypothetical protein